MIEAYTRTVFGKKGAGKTTLSMLLVIDTLVNTERFVVTNAPVCWAGLADYMERHHPSWDGNLTERIRLLDLKETREFWLYRKHGFDTSYNSEGNPDFGTDDDPKVDHSVCYIIDEAHICFDARWWQKSSSALTFYNSQARKFDDAVWFVTQFESLLDVRAKGFSEEFVYIENNSNMRYLWLFRGLPYMTADAYKNMRTKSGKNNGLAVWTKRFTLGKGIEKTFDTSRGVGVRGLGRPETKVKRGISLFWAIPLVVGLIFGITHVPGLIGRVFGKGVQKTLGTGADAKSVQGAPTPSASVPSPSVSVAIAKPVEELYPTGYVLAGDRAYVGLSDGTWLVDGQFDRIERTGVRVNGRLHRFRLVKSSSMLPVLPLEPKSQVVSPPQNVSSAVASNGRGSWRLDPDGVERLNEPLTLK